MKRILCFFLLSLLLLPGAALATDELKVISKTPQGDLNVLGDSGAITITFNRPVIALTGVGNDLREGPMSIMPKVAGTYRWMGTSTLSFIPDKPLSYSTRYVVRVNAPITAVGGEVMDKDVNFSFVTPRPKVKRVFPNQNRTRVTLEQPIFVKFDQPVEPAEVAPFLTLTSESGIEVPLTVTTLDEEDMELRTPYWLKSLDEKIIKILPQQKLAIESKHTLRIKAGLPGKAGNLGMKKTYDLQFRTYNYFRAEGISPARDWYCEGDYYPEMGIRLFFSNPVSNDALIKHLRFSPAVELTADDEYTYESDEFVLSPAFAPNTSYTVTLDAGLQDIYGNSLAQEKTFTFRTIDYGPYLSMPSGRMISEAYLGPRFPVKVMNVYNAPFQMKAYRTPEDILQAAKMMAEYDFSVSEPDVSREYQPDILKNKVALMPFDLSEVLHEGEDTGILGLTMEYQPCPGEDFRSYNALIFLTNLSVTAKFSAINNVFWVTQLQDSSPVEGAEVELYDVNQKFLWKGMTDAEGFLETPGWKELGLPVKDSWEQPWVFALIRSGGDQVVIHSRDGTGIWPYRFGIDYRPNSEHLTNDGYIFTERGIYRPGEEVRIVGIVRDNAAGELVVPENLKVDITITDPRGKEIFKDSMPLSEYGAFHFPLELANNAKLGTYWIDCAFPVPDYLDLPEYELEWMNTSIQGSFRVEKYRPVEFEVGIDLKQTEYIKGDPIEGEISANYLFGGALRDVALEWNLNRSPYSFWSENPQFKGYTFTTYDSRESAHVASDTGTLDENGEYQYSYTIADAESGSYSYSLDATVTDVNKRQVSHRQNVIMHGGEYYIGLKPASFFASIDEEFSVKTLAVTPDEAYLPDQEYQVQVKRVWWESVRRAGNGGRLYWESERKEEVVQEFQVVSGEKPVDLTFSFDRVGYYKIEASGTDQRGNEIQSEDYCYAIGSGYAAWLMEDDDYVELVPDSKTYQPGDRASVLVKSPYEKVKALVTIEREGIIDRWVETIEGSADTIEIPIKPEYIPNAYVGVILIQERVAYNKIEDELDLGKPGFKIGYTELTVNPAERRLQVEIETAQQEYRPGSEVEIRLQVSDKDGVGQEAEVVVSVVDVGVLNLINYATPDPFDYFYRSRPLGVLTSELRNSIVGQRNYSQKGERQGGGGGVDAAAMMEMIQLREKFKPTAYHNPEVRTDADGQATVRFTLPDNLTSFRIMATAHTKNALFGANDTRIKVNKKLMLTSSLPAFLRIGDTIQAGVLAHNRTGEESDVLVQAETEGLVLASPDMQELALPSQDKQEVLFSYHAEDEQEATLMFRAKMEEETDGLKITLPILLHRLPLTTALFGNTAEDMHREFIQKPEDALPGWGEVNFSLSSTLFTDLQGSTDYLFGYPYGCLEQKISKILPIILAEDLIAAFNLEVFENEDYRTVVQKTLDEFSSYQHGPSGGFGYWKRPYRPSAFVSAYAMFTLAMAQREGYEVDEDVESQGLKYLENVLKGQNERASLYRYNMLAWNVTDAFILYVLALYDEYQPAYATRLYEVRDRLPVFGKALLMKAIHQGQGDTVIRDTLRDELLNAARVEARTAYFDDNDTEGLAWIHYSNVRSTAAVAQALMDVYGASPDNEALIGKVVQWLLRERKQKLHWRTTQENLFVFWSLATYLRTFEGTVPNFTATVLLNRQEEILSEVFQGRTTQIASKSVPLDQFPSDQNTLVEFVKDGKGRFYYTTVLTYLPSGTPEPIDYGIALQKSMTVVKGKGKGTGMFHRGDIIKIDLTVTTPRDRLFLFVDDPLPAGFKALNLGLKTTDQSLREFVKDESSFRYSEYQDDRVVFYADYLGQGVHTLSYLVSAEHSGRFNLPPTFSAEMYTPEVFGQTGTDIVEIQ